MVDCLISWTKSIFSICKHILHMYWKWLYSALQTSKLQIKNSSPSHQLWGYYMLTARNFWVTSYIFKAFTCIAHALSHSIPKNHEEKYCCFSNIDVDMKVENKHHSEMIIFVDHYFLHFLFQSDFTEIEIRFICHRHTSEMWCQVFANSADVLRAKGKVIVVLRMWLPERLLSG